MLKKLLDMILGMFGLGGKQGVDQLIETLSGATDSGQQKMAADALAKIGGPAVAPLLGLLTDPSKVDLQDVIGQILVKIGLPSVGPLESLLGQTDDDDLKGVLSGVLDSIQK